MAISVSNHRRCFPTLGTSSNIFIFLTSIRLTLTRAFILSSRLLLSDRLVADDEGSQGFGIIAGDVISLGRDNYRTI